MAACWPSARTYSFLRCRFRRPSLKPEWLRIGGCETLQAGNADGSRANRKLASRGDCQFSTIGR
jgi:hypothetical protein